MDLGYIGVFGYFIGGVMVYDVLYDLWIVVGIDFDGGFYCLNDREGL